MVQTNVHMMRKRPARKNNPWRKIQTSENTHFLEMVFEEVSFLCCEITCNYIIIG